MSLFLALTGCYLVPPIVDCDGCEGQLVHLVDGDQDLVDVDWESGPMPNAIALWPVECGTGVIGTGGEGWFVTRVDVSDYPVEPGILTGRMQQEVVIHPSWAMAPGGLYEVEVFLDRLFQRERGMASWHLFIQAGNPEVQSATLEELCEQL